MTFSASPEDLLRQKDEEIRRLMAEIRSRKAEAAWYEGQAKHASDAASDLMKVINECFLGFSQLLTTYHQLSKTVSSCSININDYIVAHANGKTFDPFYLNQQVNLMVRELSASNESMTIAYDKVFNTVDSLKSIQEELLKAPPPFANEHEAN